MYNQLNNAITSADIFKLIKLMFIMSLF